MTDWDFTGLKATFVNCTLKKSPEPSHTQGLVDASAAIMRAVKSWAPPTAAVRMRTGLAG